MSRKLVQKNPSNSRSKRFEYLVRRFTAGLDGKAKALVLARGEVGGYMYCLLRVPSEPLEALTPKQRALARMLAEGRTLDEAARKLRISRHCAEKRRNRLYKNLKITSRAQLVNYMIVAG